MRMRMRIRMISGHWSAMIVVVVWYVRCSHQWSLPLKRKCMVEAPSIPLCIWHFHSDQHWGTKTALFRQRALQIHITISSNFIYNILSRICHVFTSAECQKIILAPKSRHLETPHPMGLGQLNAAAPGDLGPGCQPGHCVSASLALRRQQSSSQSTRHGQGENVEGLRIISILLDSTKKYN